MTVLFLICVFVGLHAFYKIVERMVWIHACVIGKRDFAKDPMFNIFWLTWLVCSTYNCWYLFVKGL